MLKRLSIFQRFAIIGVLMSAALLAVAAIGTLSLNRTLAAADAIIDRHKQIEILSQSSMAALLNVRRYEKDLLLNIGDPVKQEDYLKKWQGAVAATAKIYDEIAVVMPVYAGSAALLRRTLGEYEVSAQKVIGDSMLGKYALAGEANDAITIVAKELIHRIEENARAVAKQAVEEAAAARAQAAADAAVARFVMIGLSLAAIAAALGSIGYLAAGIIRSLAHAVGVAKSVADGKLDNEIRVDTRDETGDLLLALGQMQRGLLERTSAEQRLAAENRRIKLALDSSMNGTMIFDASGTIIYVNQAQFDLLRAAASDMREDLPDFDANDLVGRSADIFHRNPGEQRRMLAELSSPRRSEIRIGARTFTVALTPVVDACGERHGVAASWVDRTAELKIEREVEAIVAAARQGDFSGRLSAVGKQGFHRTLTEGLNEFLDTTAQGLADVAGVLRALAQGNLTRKIARDYQGTLGELKEDANGTVDQLQAVVGRIKAATDAIDVAAREMATGNANLSRRTETQAGSLEETASSMEELNATVRKNADNARHASELARGSNEIAGRGGAMVRQVVATMDEIQERSRKIADIVGIIDGIAFQTNILALNAAVEAARAGQQGRGFAVVATEVQSLAQRSAGAAKEIKHLIADSVGKVEDGARLVARAGATMDEVVSSFRQVAALVTDISHASGEQSAGIEQVALAVCRMDETTQQNAALVEEVAAVAGSLQEQVHSLVQTVGMFRLEDGGRVARLASPSRDR